MACLPWELQRGKAENWAPCTFLCWKFGHVTCHMIMLSTCPFSSVAGSTYTRDAIRALPILIAGLFIPRAETWCHVPGFPFAYYYRGSKFTAINFSIRFFVLLSIYRHEYMHLSEHMCVEL